MDNDIKPYLVTFYQPVVEQMSIEVYASNEQEAEQLAKERLENDDDCPLWHESNRSIDDLTPSVRILKPSENT